ncbi:MAG: NADH-quinone oxidoreductase subunit C [Bryobacterales bacterium]|nr:NADH-quinone oxidoreductase subunit C [Bryobacterales bacterium]
MASTPWAGDLPDQVKKEFGDGIVECATYLGQDFILAKPATVAALIGYLKREADYEYLVDVTAAHYPKRAGEEFDLFYVLYSFSRNHRLRVKTRFKDGASIESVTGVHIGANWLERECFDMFGIRFDGHPNLKRILLPDEWEGHPLRKEYSIIKMDERWVQENLGIESAQ